jgi:5'-3' exonuclease
MDCNSIIYDSYYNILKSDKVNVHDHIELENAIIQQVIQKIEHYIQYLKPKQTVFIAFDGVAPFAKMEQQRTRRNKGHFISKIPLFSKESTWELSSITPGTNFMNNLSQIINQHFKHSETNYNVKNIIISCSDQRGEGEHKLFSHLRANSFENDNVAVYGLDSDLIMLSVFHLKYCKNIYIFREAPEFLKNSIPVDCQGEEPHFIDIQHLGQGILSHMGCTHSSIRRLYDYVFICFFLGNDFLPHFPAMNIRTHGIDVLLEIYNKYVGSYADAYFISENGNIQWKYVSKFVNEIAKREHEYLVQEYFVRDKYEKFRFPENNDEEKKKAFENTPIVYRAEEKYICPSEQYWDKRYYQALFKTEKNTSFMKTLCNNYLEGLEWVCAYYSGDCPDWKWKYNYHYPPLFSDLCKYIPHFETKFIEQQLTSRSTHSFSPYTQLAYVLPKQQLYLLPEKIQKFLLDHYSELYCDEYEFQWAFCRYFWESHPVLPKIELDMLEKWDLQFRMHTE